MGGAEATGGMTLRDFFAGQALNMAGTYNVMSPSSTSEEDAAAIAKGAYALADAMLAEREKGAKPC